MEMGLIRWSWIHAWKWEAFGSISLVEAFVDVALVTAVLKVPEEDEH